MKQRLFPVASLVALLLIGLAWAYLIGSETPRGQIQGVTVLTDVNNKPLAECDVYLTPATNSETDDTESLSFHGFRQDVRERRHVQTDKQGHFSLRGVPAGTYMLSASARWHSSADVKVEVQEGKIATNELRLTRSEADLSIGDHQATFSGSETPFLPVRGYTTVPQVSKDIPTKAAMQVKIWRTKLSDVLKRQESAAALEQMRYSYNGNQSALPDALLKPDPREAQAPTLIYEKTTPILGADREGFFTDRFKLPAAQGKPGLYLVKFSYGKFSSCSYVLVTNLALVVKKSSTQTVAYAAHLEKGTPIPGARVRTLRLGQTIASGTTDKDGLTELATSSAAPSLANDGENGITPITMVTSGADEAVVNGSNYGGGGSEQYAVHVVTDRTVYRPGDTVQYKGIVRTNGPTDTQNPTYAIPRGVPVTVEIRDASGGLVQRTSKTTSSSGTFWGSADISSEGATGSYTVTTTVGGEDHTSDLTVAAYRKPEYSVTMTPVKPRYRRGETVEMQVNATYYFGAPVAGAKVRYYIYRDADWSAEYGDAGNYSDGEYDSDASAYRSRSYNAYYGEAVGDGEVTLDENGKAVVKVRTDIRYPERVAEDDSEKKDEEAIPQSEIYTFSAEVEDEAKRAVSAEGTATVAAGDLAVSVAPEGYVSTPGKPMQVFVTVRDADKKVVPNASVTLAVEYDEWNPKKKESITRQVGAPQNATTGPDGRATLAVTPTKNGEFRLVATTKDGGGRLIRAEGSLWAASDSGDDLSTDYGDLSLLTDKRQYEPGDTARVLVNTSRLGQNVILTVEGNRVYQTISVPVKKHSTVVTLPIQNAWGSNVVLVANYVRDKKFASSQTPLRVHRAARELAVAIQPVGGTKYHPGDRVTYAVTTKDKATGKPVASDFAFGVVDESIYALQEDNPKALQQAFYPPRANQVVTNFSFSVQYLGDVSKAEPQIKARTKFKDTAYWKPDGRTGADGSATVTITLPDNLTTWRATVNAISDSTAVGYGINKIVSNKPFFLRLETPRYLVGGDSSRLMALVHNDTGKEQNIQVRLIAGTLKLTGDETQSVKVASGGVGTVEWAVSPAANTSDAAPLRVTAWTPKETGQTQYTDGIEKSLPVHAYGRTETTTFAGAMESNPSSLAPDTLTGAPGDLTLRLDSAAVPAETRLNLRVTPSVRGVFASGIEYLVGFPYGCTEQTMSRFYPDLLAHRFGILSGTKTQQQLPRMVGDGLARLSRFQHTDTGGWGWWESDKDDPFMTAYVLIGLSAAKAQGYTVDDAFLQRGVKAAAEMAPKAGLRQRAFLLYALSESGYQEDASKMLHAPFIYSAVRTKMEPSKLPVDALAYLTLLGRKLGANYQPFYNELQRRATIEGRLTHWQSLPGKQVDYSCSDRMATALALRTMLAVEPNNDRIGGTLRYLMKSRTDGYFGDTRDTAWVLVALCDYLKTHPADAARPSGTLAVQVNDTTVRTINLATDAEGENEIVLNLPTTALRPGANSVRFVRSNGSTGGTVFYSGSLRQTVAADAEKELPAARQSGVTVKREVLRVLPRKVGSDLWRLATEPVTNGKFAQGDQLRIRLTITAERDASYVMIEDRFPSGAEVTERGTADEEVSDSGSGGSYFWYDHVDVRDDRIAFFAGKLPKGKHVLEYNLRAQTPGTCYALPAVIETMYDPGFHGESGATPLEVAK